MRVLALLVSITTFGAILAVTTLTVTTEAATEVQTSTSAVRESDSGDVVRLLGDQERSSVLSDLVSSEDEEEENEESEREEEQNNDPEPIIHTVEKGDTLTKIAKEHEIQWIRIWQKNGELEHPDMLMVEDELVIPFEDEELDPRDLPEPTVEEQAEAHEATSTFHEQETQSQPAQPARESTQSRQQPTRQQQAPQQPARTAPRRAASSANTYTPGYCTWYVKNQRPDIPNGLGNANMWLSNAQAMGMSTGSQPRVGAVAQTSAYSFGHVAIVTAVHGDGTITVSEMNFTGYNQVSSRRVSASSFSYIY